MQTLTIMDKAVIEDLYALAGFLIYYSQWKHLWIERKTLPSRNECTFLVKRDSSYYPKLATNPSVGMV